MRYKLIVSYDGGPYSGWQRQSNCNNTIQGILENLLSTVLNEDVELVSSGRTDKGVSAQMQVCHFDTINTICVNQTKAKLYLKLPSTIKLVSITKVPDTFHARYNAKEKTYSYKFYASKSNIPYLDSFCAHYKHDIDISVFTEQMKKVVGKYNFSSFCSSKSSVENRVREVYSVKLVDCDGFYNFIIKGNGFLYNMVRIIVGTLLDISSSRVTKDILEIIESQDRNMAGITAPSKGLCLIKVDY